MVKRFAKVTTGGVTRFVKFPLPGVTPGPGDPTRWMFSSVGINPPITNHTVNSSGLQYGVTAVRTTTPDYPITKLKIWWSNFWTLATGAANPETANTNPIRVRASWSLDNVTWTPCTFASGQSEITIATPTTPADAHVPCDDIVLPSAVTASPLYIRTYRTTDVGGTVPGAYSINNGANIMFDGIPISLGTAYSSSQATALALLSGGTITDNSFSTNKSGYGPSLVVSNGWDGRACVLIPGDSIGYYNGKSYCTQGLEDKSNGGLRLPLANFAVQGTRPHEQDELIPGEYQFRDSLIQAVKAVNGGRLPFTSILSEMGVNDAGNDAYMRGWWAFLKSRYGVPVVQTELTPRTGHTGNTFWTTLADQTVTGGTERFATNAAMPGYVASGLIDGFVSMADVWFGPSPYQQVFKVFPETLTLAAPYTPGQTTITFTSKPSERLLIFAFEPGTSNAEVAGGPITSIVDNGDGTWTCDANGILKSHAAGTTAKVVPTRDGIHPTVPMVYSADPTKVTATSVLAAYKRNVGFA